MPPLHFSQHPEISVILPTYNRANHLNKCIDSVINQTFKGWELIIVDDGSQDETFAVVDPYLQEFAEIRYLKHKNRKLGLSRNAGIQASFGRYITFIDSDDQYKPNHLQTRIDYMKAHAEIDLIEGGFEADGDVWVADCYKPGAMIHLNDCVLGPTFFGKRHVFFELGGFTEITYAEDTELWERAEKQFKTQKITDPKTYLYTRADDSITKTVSEGLNTGFNL